MDNNILIDCFAIAISLLALLFSLLQFSFERARNIKEATIHAFDDLENNQDILYLFSLNKDEIDRLLDQKIKNVAGIEKRWESIKNALSLIEHFSVGINNRVYSLKILNSMAGNKFIETYYNCSSLITHKREGKGNSRNYSEFEIVSTKLKKIRKITGYEIPET